MPEDYGWVARLALGANININNELCMDKARMFERISLEANARKTALTAGTAYLAGISFDFRAA